MVLSTLQRFTTLATVVLAFLLVPTIDAHASCSAPADQNISVSPSEGPPGTVVTVSGTSPADNVITVEGLGGSAQAVSNGSFSVELTVSNLPPDCHQIQVTHSPPNGGLGYFAFANFTVTGDETPPHETPPPDDGGVPDLEPTDITFDSTQLVIGQPVHFDSGITNHGDTPTDVFNIKWFVDGEEVGAYGSHDGLPPNTTTLDGNSQFDWTFDTPGTYTITFTVDADNHIPESNEDNNSRNVTVEVTAPQSGSDRDTLLAKADEYMALPMAEFLKVKEEAHPDPFYWHDNKCSGSPDVTPQGFDFSNPCKRHDFGYYTYGNGKNIKPPSQPLRLDPSDERRLKIDDIFYQDMLRVCKAYGLLRTACESDAWLYHQGVLLCGNDNFFTMPGGERQGLLACPEVE